MMNENRFTFNDALLTALFGTPNRKNTMDRLGIVATVFPDEELRMAAVILRERVKKMDDFSWTALCKMAKWEIGNLFDSERLIWDDDGDLDLDDEDEDTDERDTFPFVPVEDAHGYFE